jgi:hypothetical protein
MICLTWLAMRIVEGRRTVTNGDVREVKQEKRPQFPTIREPTDIRGPVTNWIRPAVFRHNAMSVTVCGSHKNR